MKTLASKNEALENIKNLINSEIGVNLLFEHLDTAIIELCKYKMTDTNFVGAEKEFDTIYILSCLKNALSHETTELKTAS